MAKRVSHTRLSNADRRMVYGAKRIKSNASSAGVLKVKIKKDKRERLIQRYLQSINSIVYSL